MQSLLERAAEGAPRHDWTRAEARALVGAPFNDLLFAAQRATRAHFDGNEVQMSELLSIKTGGCPEDCGYCSQSARFETGLRATRLMEPDEVAAAARKAKAGGATRFCMGAAWREPKDRDMPALTEIVRVVKAEGLETCMTLGMLTGPQARALAEAGLDYYNHNIDTSPEYYPEIITTRTFDDRLETLARVRAAGIHVCCGGIVGMGESEEDRVGMLVVLATLPEHPGSVPINALMPAAGTPLANARPLDGLDFVRTVAAARLMMPTSVVRLSAGREHMSDELQALCLLAGANSVFVGEKLLTAKNPGRTHDQPLFDRLGVRAMPAGAE
ncbi:MAG: biotin synthase BioB [Alphaproteobacteria bacterium]